MKTPVRPIHRAYNRKEIDKLPISIYWWNMGTKTLDFKGQLGDYLKKRNIVITPFVKNQQPGYKCKISTSSTSQTLVTYDDYLNAAKDAIRLFLTMMGDKAVFNAPIGRTYYINWR
jgi:hypothetical protein